MVDHISSRQDITSRAQFVAAIKKNKSKRVRRILKSMHPAKAASLLESLTVPERAAAWDQIDRELEASLLKYLSPQLRAALTQAGNNDEDSKGAQEEQTDFHRLWEALEGRHLKQVGQILAGEHPARVAGFLESIPGDNRILAWEMLDNAQAAEVLPHLHDEVRADLAVQTDLDELVMMTQFMELDDLVDLLQDLPDEHVRDLMRAMDDRNREQLEAMLSYPEESAGGLMNLDHIQVRADVTLRTVLRYLRLLEGLPDNTNQLMVVDRDNQYLGTLRLRDLLTNEPRKTVQEVMDPDPPHVLVNQSQADVAKLFEQEDLISVPVLEDRGILVGRITVDDVMDVIRDESEHSLMGRVGMNEKEDLFAPILISGRRRSVWLGINLLTAFLAAWVIGLFEATLDKVVALAVLMPVVASMGGIAGSQTLTLMIRALALGHVESSNARRLLWKEIGVGLLNGFIWALVVALVSVLWFGDYGIGGVIAVAMVINLLCAALAGVVIPLLMRQVGVDPALAGGVVLTTVTDVVGFLSFLGLATILLI